VSLNTKTDLTHRRSVALTAQPHPKCPFQAGRLRVRVTVFLPTSTGVLVSERDYRDAELARSIRHLTYSSYRIEGRRLDPKLLTQYSGVVLVLFSGRSVGAAQSQKSNQRGFDMFGIWIDC